MLKLALLGADLPSLALARAVIDGNGHQILWAGELGSAGPLFRGLAPTARQSDDWESLLAAPDIDAVLVARAENDDVRADQLRKLVQEGVPLLVSHPVHSSMLIYYELDMIRREVGGVLLPNLSARWHPAVGRVRELLADNGPDGLGRLEQIVVERTLAERTRQYVAAQFAVDMDLVRSLCGDLNKIGAMASGAGDERYANLGVQLSGPANVLVRWSVGPVEQAAGARMTLVTAGGKATLTMPQDDGSWKLTVARGQQQPRVEDFPPWDAAGHTLSQLEQAIAGDDVRPNWIDASRSVELADTIERCLNKGRTVELYFEDYTEHATFKGTMTSLGCGLIVASMFVLVVAAFTAKLGLPIGRYWAWFLLAVMCLFLLLQSLKLVFPANESKSDRAG